MNHFLSKFIGSILIALFSVMAGFLNPESFVPLGVSAITAIGVIWKQEKTN